MDFGLVWDDSLAEVWPILVLRSSGTRLALVSPQYQKGVDLL